MITLIHGEDTAASRNYYFDLKQKSQNSILLDGISITQTDLQQALSGDDLFGTKKDIFIENLISKRKPSKELDTLISLLIAHNSALVTLWESKELTPKQVTQFSKATVRLFKIPSTIFAFLDAIKPANGKQMIEHFHKTLEDKDPEFVLFMLTRLIRTLLALRSVILGNEVTPESDSGQARMTISEVSRLAPWQRGKVEKQAKLFTVDQLLHFHEQLFQLELNMKTGGLTLPLTESMDLLLVSL